MAIGQCLEDGFYGVVPVAILEVADDEQQVQSDYGWDPFPCQILNVRQPTDEDWDDIGFAD